MEVDIYEAHKPPAHRI